MKVTLPATLTALPKLLTNKAYRQSITGHVTDPAVRQFFDVYEEQHDRLRDESIAPVLNKVSKFVTHRLLRAVIGQERSSFDFRWLMDKKKILLVNLSKGALGEDVSSLLGSLVVTKLALASLSARTRQKTNESRTSSTWTRRTTSATASTSHDPLRVPKIPLGPGPRHADAGPTSRSDERGNLRERRHDRLLPVSHDDAQTLVRHFAVSGEGPKTAEQIFDTVVPASEVQNLPDHKFYFQTLVTGRPHDPERVDAFPPMQRHHMMDIWKRNGRTARRQEVVRVSGERFGRDRAAVERKIKRFLSAV